MERVRWILRSKGDAVWSLNPETSVYEAIQMMAEKGVGALLVVSDDNEVVGIISERDYARKVILKDRSSKDTKVRDIMTSPVITVTPDHTVDECMRIMASRRVRHLPVLEDGRLAGVVSIGDLVNHIITAQGETIRHLNDYIAGQY